MNKTKIKLIIFLALIAGIAAFVIYALNRPSDQNIVTEILQPNAILPEEITDLRISNYDESSDTLTNIWMLDYNGQPIYSYSINGEELMDMKTISEEDNAKILQLASEYSVIVARDKNNYWPDSDEYPAMMTLFDFEIVSDKEHIRYDGALGKPEGYDDFIKELDTILRKYADQ